MTKRSDALRDRALSAAVPRVSPMGRWGGERRDGEAVVPAAGETFPFPPPPPRNTDRRHVAGDNVQRGVQGVQLHAVPRAAVNQSRPEVIPHPPLPAPPPPSTDAEARGSPALLRNGSWGRWVHLLGVMLSAAVCGRSRFSPLPCLVLLIAASPRCNNSTPVCISSSQVGLRRH